MIFSHPQYSSTETDARGMLKGTNYGSTQATARKPSTFTKSFNSLDQEVQALSKVLEQLSEAYAPVLKQVPKIKTDTNPEDGTVPDLETRIQYVEDTSIIQEGSCSHESESEFEVRIQYLQKKLQNTQNFVTDLVNRCALV